MSFSFSFSGDDIEDEAPDDNPDALADGISKIRISDSLQSNAHVMPPKRHSLEELLASLPSQISYNKLHISPHSSSRDTLHDEAAKHGDLNHDLITKIYRRSLFDIRAQLMVEANPSSTDEADSAEMLLAGLENGDLSSGIYEGGFKTWECALDLASMLIGPTSPFSQDEDVEQDWELIELGAGSAIPSLAVLGEFLRRKDAAGKSQEGGSLRLTLCDYNEDVLRLATAPNVFLNYLFSSSKASSATQQASVGGEEGDLDLEELGGEFFTSNMVESMLADKISLDFLSGGWGDKFVHLITSPASSVPSQSKRPANLLILASETIYSLGSIKTFSQTLVTLLKSHHQRGREAKAWIAAKKVYFGVGGGVDEFEREISSLGGTSQVILENKDTGVGRVVLEVTSIT